MVQTSVPNLWLVSGNQALLEMANLEHGQKERLVRQIQRLDVDDVVLDLGAGSAFNVLDFFLLARRGLVVATPEPTAIENAEHFLRAAFYRSLRDRRTPPRRGRGDPAAARERPRAPSALRGGAHRARARDRPARREAPRGPRAGLRADAGREPGPDRGAPPRRLRSIVASCRERLGVAIELAGSIDADPNVAAAVERRQPALQAFPLCRFSRQIEALAKRLQRRGAGPREREEESGLAVQGRGAGGDAAPRALRRRRAAPPAAAAGSGRARRLPAPVSRGAGPEPRGDDRADADPHPGSHRERALRAAAARALSQGLPVEYARALELPEIADLAKCYLAKAPARPPESPPAPQRSGACAAGGVRSPSRAIA